jgi:hypothetical protein
VASNSFLQSGVSLVTSCAKASLISLGISFYRLQSLFLRDMCVFASGCLCIGQILVCLPRSRGKVTASSSLCNCNHVEAVICFSVLCESLQVKPGLILELLD